MMYKKETGFAAIRHMEPDEALKVIDASLRRNAEELSLTLEGAVKGTVGFVPEDSVETVLIRAAFELSNFKFLHLGAPLGIIVTKKELRITIGELMDRTGVSFGSQTAYIGDYTDCAVNYLRSVLNLLKPESCGRCVLCRMGIDQLIRIFDDAVNGKGRPDDLDTLRTLSNAMKKAAYCRFGKAVGALIESFCQSFSAEFEDHTKRKKCTAMVCEKYLTYIIQPNLCTGCGECMDICQEDAIEGKPRYIHMIDEFECSRCGKCVNACEENAIILVGANKPKLPMKLTKVGTWRGR